MQLAPALLILLSALLLPLGLTLPLMRLDRLYVFTDEPSLIDVVTGLWSDGSAVLAIVVALVSIAFPLTKLAVLQLAVVGYGGPILRHLHALGRWSMMDVLIVALVIFGAKTSGLAEAIAEPGLWAYAGSTITAAVAAILLERRRPV